MTAMPHRGLYAITDPQLLPGDRLITGVAAALRGGAVLVQYRNKTGTSVERLSEAANLRALCQEHRVPLIINDDPDLARRCEAHGVHLGREDPALDSARALLGPEVLIGATCQADPDYARSVAGQPADYVAFGRFFASQTKQTATPASLSVLEQARALAVPTVAIGGITLDNAASVIAAGADLTAVVHGLFGAEDIEARARDFSQLFAD